jgi:hypothetical protein
VKPLFSKKKEKKKRHFLYNLQENPRWPPFEIQDGHQQQFNNKDGRQS